MQRTYRVAVRGRLTGLDAATRAALTERLDEHSIFSAEHTPTGSLTYEADLRFFTVRLLVVEEGDDPASCDAAAAETGVVAAELLLAERGLSGRGLRASATSVDDVHARLRR